MRISYMTQITGVSADKFDQTSGDRTQDTPHSAEAEQHRAGMEPGFRVTECVLYIGELSAFRRPSKLLGILYPLALFLHG